MNKAQKWLAIYGRILKNGKKTFKIPPKSIATKHIAPDGVIEYTFSDKSEIHYDKKENNIIILNGIPK